MPCLTFESKAAAYPSGVANGAALAVLLPNVTLDVILFQGTNTLAYCLKESVTKKVYYHGRQVGKTSYFLSFWSFVIVTLMPLLQMKIKSLLILKQHSHYTT